MLRGESKDAKGRMAGLGKCGSDLHVHQLQTDKQWDIQKMEDNIAIKKTVAGGWGWKGIPE